MPLLWLSVAFMAGIIIGSTFSLSWLLVAVGFLLGLGAGWLERRQFANYRLVERWQKFSPVPAGFLLAAVMAGTLRYQVSIPVFTEADLAWYNDQGELQVRGWISAPPDERDRIDILEITAEEIVFSQNYDDQNKFIEVDGKLIAMVRAGRDWQYGDEVLITGPLATPPENEEFSCRDYLARQGIYSYLGYLQMKKLGSGRGNILMKATTALRDRAYVFINGALPQPEASLLAGILLGIETDIPTNVEDAFQETGTTHIIAISGFNIAILAGLFISLSSRYFSKRWAPWIALAGISFYTVLVGAAAAPPVVRAAVMGGMGLFGKMFGRRQTGANSLTFTAAVMCLFNPDLLWDAGFQLSFAATMGLVLYADPLQAVFERLAERWFSQETARRIAAPISEYFLFTLAAQVTTLPIIAWHFHRISLSSMLANPLIPAAPAPGDDLWRTGSAAWVGLSLAGKAGGGAHLAFAGLHHPHGGTSGKAATGIARPGPGECLGRGRVLLSPAGADPGLEEALKPQAAFHALAGCFAGSGSGGCPGLAICVHCAGWTAACSGIGR